MSHPIASRPLTPLGATDSASRSRQAVSPAGTGTGGWLGWRLNLSPFPPEGCPLPGGEPGSQACAQLNTFPLGNREVSYTPQRPFSLRPHGFLHRPHPVLKRGLALSGGQCPAPEGSWAWVETCAETPVDIGPGNECVSCSHGHTGLPKTSSKPQAWPAQGLRTQTRVGDQCPRRRLPHLQTRPATGCPWPATELGDGLPSPPHQARRLHTRALGAPWGSMGWKGPAPHGTREAGGDGSHGHPSFLRPGPAWAHTVGRGGADPSPAPWPVSAPTHSKRPLCRRQRAFASLAEGAGPRGGAPLFGQQELVCDVSRDTPAVAAGPTEKGPFFRSLASEARRSLVGAGGDKTCFLFQMPRKCGGGGQGRPLRWLFWEAGDKRGAGGRESDRVSWDLPCPLPGGQ